MPYIEPSKRSEIDPIIKELDSCLLSSGDVNYAITKLIHLYVLSFGKNYIARSKGKSILQDALDEYKRRVMDVYEDIKCKENGPISELDGL